MGNESSRQQIVRQQEEERKRQLLIARQQEEERQRNLLIARQQEERQHNLRIARLQQIVRQQEEKDRERNLRIARQQQIVRQQEEEKDRERNLLNRQQEEERQRNLRIARQQQQEERRKLESGLSCTRAWTSSNSIFSENSQTSGSTTNTKKQYKIPTSQVFMPSGITFTITLPSKPKCFCKEFIATKLINIWPKSRIAPGEHQMICNEMSSTIKQHVTGTVTGYDIITIQKVKNCCIWTKYRNRRWDIMKETGENNINERMLFHGSMAADDIVQRGFDERHSDAGGMFGAGVYFAEHSSKSNQYVFGSVGSRCATHRSSECTLCERKMILCRVVLGNTLIRHSADKMSHPPPGYHSVTGSTLYSLKYPEYVIYRGEQAYPEYLITYKCRN